MKISPIEKITSTESQLFGKMDFKKNDDRTTFKGLDKNSNRVPVPYHYGFLGLVGLGIGLIFATLIILIPQDDKYSEKPEYYLCRIWYGHEFWTSSTSGLDEYKFIPVMESIHISLLGCNCMSICHKCIMLFCLDNMDETELSDAIKRFCLFYHITFQTQVLKCS